MDEPQSVELPTDVLQRIEQRLSDGDGIARSAGDVLRAGLDALDAQDARRLVVIREKLDRAVSGASPSRPADEVFDRLETVIEALRRV